MRGKLTLQQRLILPIVLLGLVAFLSNVLAVFSINNVHSNARTIVDKYMVSEGRLEEIRRSIMDIHLLALSHIVAADHATMIQLVQEIKTEEAALDETLAGYGSFVAEEDMARTSPFCRITTRLNTHWSIWCAPVPTVRHRRPTQPPTGM